MTDAAVIGARGYLGRETVRLLHRHPAIDTVLPSSRSAVGDRFQDHVPAFRDPSLEFVDEDDALDADIVFTATPGGEAKRLAPRFDEQGTRLVVDLSRDWRLPAIEDPDGSGWTYGLADVRPVAKGTTRIANPGCYPTASLLASAPALQAGLAAPGVLIADGKSGVSGAGVQPKAPFHFPEANESVKAYKVEEHDHRGEIQAMATLLDGSPGATEGSGGRTTRFTPHLIPQTRGLLSTVYLPLDTDGDALQKAYDDAYGDAPFVHMVDEPNTGHVAGSNHADVAVFHDTRAGLLVARCAIDNLVKGGAGTAVQNMNDALGHDPTTGLETMGVSP